MNWAFEGRAGWIVPILAGWLFLILSFPVTGWADDSKDKKGEQARAAGQMQGTARRNENVPVYQIDTNAQKELDKRVGITLRIPTDLLVERSYFAAEFGQASRGEVTMPKTPAATGWHGELYNVHESSVFNARSFFQVGAVQPSHENSYGVSVGGPAGRLGDLFAAFAQQKIRGMVNGNVLVPLAAERAPKVTDPERRAVVQCFLNAFPDELPNRPDFDPRALNTNAPQRSDAVQAIARLDRDFLKAGRLALSHSLTRQRIDAFQFVAGQHPDTELHGHDSRLSWSVELSPISLLQAGFRFQTTRSVLKPEPNAVGPRVRFGFQIEELGPDSRFPIDRKEAAFTGGGLLRRTAGARHRLVLGGDLSRDQLNSSESNDLRGYFQFTNDFGRTAIENFLLGTPTKYEVTIGNIPRRFTDWRANLFFADQWQALPSVSVYWGLRYSLETTPVEVDRLTVLPYASDANNFAPRLSLALRLPSAWVMRASYGTSFGRIYPVTYQQARNNPPLVRQFQIQHPDLLNPLAGIELSDSAARYSPLLVSRDLVTPYSHQYGLTLERPLGDYSLRLGYVGSRSFKLFGVFALNRAQILPGIFLRSDNVNERRADLRHSEIIHIVNSGIAYLDAARAEVEKRYSSGLSWRAAYTFSKAIDLGPDYSSTAAGSELASGRNQSENDAFRDLKGLSNFDSPHAFSLNTIYDIPSVAGAHYWARHLFNGWQLNAALLLKKGTPLTLYIGSDAPGFGNVDGSPSERPNILDPSILGMTVGDPDEAPRILRRDRFAYIKPGEHRGNLGRATFRKSAIQNLNLALAKFWRPGNGARWTILLRAEAYNLTNTPQFDEPQRNLTSPAFGKITNTLNDGRIMQFHLQMGF
ncbi:MAG: TonB-dependent receptor domain-containing protein [Acidobacteriota bacterium]